MSLSRPQTAPAPEPEKKPSKEGDWLFHATPTNLMRDFNPDRPGATNTPFTIDAGHFQLEVEAFNFSRTKTNDITTDQLNYPAPTIRIGVTNQSEVQITWVPQTRISIGGPGGSTQVSSGAGDMTVSYKLNMLANDGGPIAWALMPAIKIPTNTGGVGNDKLEPTLMLPFSFAA